MQNALALVKVMALVVFVAAGLSIGQGSVTHFSAGADASWTLSGLLLALIPVMFSYSGWNAASYLAEEVKDPARNVPRALAMGTIAVVVRLRRDERRVPLRARRAGDGGGAGARRGRRCRGAVRARRGADS